MPTNRRPSSRARRASWAPAATLILAALSIGCAAAPPPPPLAAVGLLPVWDAPGRSAVAGVFTFDAWLRPTRDGVAALLADALRQHLTARGLRVGVAATPGGYAPVTLRDAVAAAQAARDAPAVLYVRVVTWEASDASHPQRVDARIEAALLQAGSGKVLWAAQGPGATVPTRGAADLGAAYARAADAVAAWMVGRWRASP